MTVSLKTPQEIEKMRMAGKLASEVLDYITPFVKPGITTEELDKLCHDYMVNVQHVIPAPLNYARQVSALSEIDLHLRQSSSLSWRTGREDSNRAISSTST